MLLGNDRRFSTRSKSQYNFKQQADAWMMTKWGRRFRIGLLGATVVAYPIYHLATNGPLLKYVFPRRYDVNMELPPYLQKIVQDELEKFQDHERRQPKDTIVYFGVQNKLHNLDSIASGSLGVRFGARIGLPFYSQFTSDEELLEYCRKNLHTLNLFDKEVPITWDSPVGEELRSTLLLSEKAKKFLILRDMFANDGYNAYANQAISWATWTAFSSLFTYWLHQKTKICNGSALSFVVAYGIFLVLALFAHDQWFLLYRFFADTHGDSVTSRISFDYSDGGKEYYWKMLKRNRILRDLMPDGRKHITPAGDVRKIGTKLLVRYDLLKDVGIEDDEIRAVSEGDD